MRLRNERLDIVACAEHGSYELRRRRNEERRNEERRNEERRKEERGKDVRLTLDSR
jgi:cell division protein FtsI/penicillin-binding protein 2